MIYFSTDAKHTVTLCNFNYSPTGILHPDRIMKEYDFLYMIQGCWDIIENDICYPVQEGDLLILEPGLHHYSKEKCSPSMRNMFLHCIPLKCDGESRNPSSIPIQKLTNCNNTPQISNLFRCIIKEYWNRQDNYKDLRISNLFELLLLELSVCGKETVSSDPLVNEVLQLFLSNSEYFFRLDELSSRFGISSHTLGLRFKTATNTSLYQYQLTQKLNMIHELLPQNPTRSLRDIALSFGFYDEFQFSKLYKRQFGYPPSFRRKQGF